MLGKKSTRHWTLAVHCTDCNDSGVVFFNLLVIVKKKKEKKRERCQGMLVATSHVMMEIQ